MNIPGINEIVNQMRSLDGFTEEMSSQLERIATSTERIADATERLVDLVEAGKEGISV